MTNQSQLELALKNSWSKETSLDEDNWTPKNPAWGQCAVTAAVVQDYLGGDIVCCYPPFLKGNSHYFNKIAGKEVDLTRGQFPPGTEIPEGQPKTKEFATTREYILSFERTETRYQLLSDRVKEFIENFT